MSQDLFLKISKYMMIDFKLIETLVSTAKQDDIEKLVVGCVIQISGKILLLRRVPDDFMGGLVELPSGTVDPDEDLITALKRETEEETGLTIVAV